MARARHAAFGILERDGNVLLVANWRDLGQGRVLCWDIPGGGVEPGESLVAACAREFREETGLSVRVERLAFVIERFGFLGRDPEDGTLYVFFTVACEGSLADVRPVDAGIVDAAWVPWDGVRTKCPQPYHRELHAWIDSGRRLTYLLDDPRARTAP